MDYLAQMKYYNCICSGLKKRHINCSLYSFKPRTGQDEALSAVNQFARDFLDNKNPVGLLLVGGVGSGKTYIAVSLVNYLADTMELYSSDNYFNDYTDKYIDSLKTDFSWLNKNNSVCFVVLSELYEYLRFCYSNNDPWDPKKIMNHLREVELLILDDMGAEKTSEWTKEILFNIIDYRYNEQLPLIVTTNCVPEELKGKIGDRNFDRLREMCALVSVVATSQRETAKL